MIRWRQPRDDKAIVELVRTELVPISPWQHPRDNKLYDQITRRIRRGATLVVTGTRHKIPIAFLHMELRQHLLFIDLLAVGSRYQNKHWGTALMLKAEQHATQRGCTASYVFVDEDNDKALRFYQRLGYIIMRTNPGLKVIELGKPLFYRPIFS